MVKDWHLHKYHSAARSHGKKRLASTPSRPLAFSLSFDVVHLASAACGWEYGCARLYLPEYMCGSTVSVRFK
jgi:hypothetical protein